MKLAVLTQIIDCSRWMRTKSPRLYHYGRLEDPEKEGKKLYGLAVIR